MSLSGEKLTGGSALQGQGIPTVRDRVIQMATLLILEPIFEEDFEDCLARGEAAMVSLSWTRCAIVLRLWSWVPSGPFGTPRSGGDTRSHQGRVSGGI